MSKLTNRAKPVIDPVIFEALIDRLEFPLERTEVRELLIALFEESGVRMCEGDGILRTYRRRTLKEIIEATIVRVIR